MSSSSSSDGLTYTQRLVRENIDEFRAYSLDPDLIEQFYNKGEAGQEVHLEPENSSSSSSESKALIRITLANKTKAFLDPDEKLPDDLQFHVYDQGGATVAPSKTPGEDEATVEVDGEWPVSFQLNIEHPRYREARIRFVVPQPGQYLHQTGMGTRTFNQKRRITQDYKGYLLQWLQQFWTLRDQGQDSLIPDLLPPAPDQPLDPFAHARSKLLEQYPENQTAAARQTPTAKSLSTATKKVNVEGRNFLGVGSEIWKCITKGGVDNKEGGLYKDVDSIKYSEGGDERLDDPDGWAPNRGFNCRAFTVAAGRYLRSQLAAICPNAKVWHYLVRGHVLLFVDMSPRGKPACPEGVDCGDCCERSFVYEPQTGEIWESPYQDPFEYAADQSDYEKDMRLYIEDNPEAGNLSWGNIGTIHYGEDGYEYEVDYSSNPIKGWIGGIDRIDWDEFPEEVERISGVVCGCLNSQNARGPETYLKQKCQDGTFGDWFKENFRSGRGLITTTAPDMPQTLECSTPRKCLQTTPISFNPETGELETGEPTCDCEEDEGGSLSESECASYCNKLHDCPECEPLCTARPEGDSPSGISFYADEQECLESCDEKIKTLRFL